ncbi:MAG: hypothetical protein HKN82_14440 [Akkermansiaceae bacterium]|nr:hypothetical protein [Akkermansiaceae bacterium]NNM30012.1 hypothetical protein [Akkermansiaceae bacterium]
MGRQRRSLVTRYRFIAWLSLGRWILLAAGATCLARAYFEHETGFLIPAAICGAAFLGSVVVFMIEAGQVRCLMCRQVLLRNMRCEKHPEARRFLGSPTLRTTLAVAVSPAKIRCHYCGGRFRMTGKHSRRREQSSGQARAASLPPRR